jgi:uncharacterized repeat protein (TIGR03803 family)
LYSFTGGSDGNDPYTGVALDAAGNVYGTTYAGGSAQLGVAYELSPSGSGWSESTIHTFAGGNDGASPSSAPIFDGSGNLYGTTGFGGGAGCVFSGHNGCGTVFELTPSGSGWNESILYNFSGSFTVPIGGLIFDGQGNLYGTTLGGGTGDNGTIFRLVNAGGSWTYQTLHSFVTVDGGAPFGAAPFGGVTFDSQGNMYGTTITGGQGQTYCTGGCGVVWKMTP